MRAAGGGGYNPRVSTAPRILIVKLSSFGDVLHALPLADTLKAGFPESRIDWVVRAGYAPLLQGNPNLDAVIPLPRKRFADGLAVGRVLRARGYDIALDIQGLFYSGWIAWLSGAPRRIGFDANREGNRLFLTDARTVSSDRAPMTEKILRVADTLGIPRTPPGPQRYLADAEPVEAQALLADIPSGATPIAVVVGASSPVKTLPPERWIGLLRAFAARGWHPVLIGGDAEKSIARTLAGALPVSDLVGKTPFRTLASVLARCRATVGGDTGALHLSVAVGTPVVGLYGVTDPARSGPRWSTTPVVVLDAGDDPTQRRFRHDAGGVIDRIADDAILDAIASLIVGASA